METTFITDNLPENYTIRVRTYPVQGVTEYVPEYCIRGYRGAGLDEWFSIPDSKHRLARKSEAAARLAINRHFQRRG